jgi:adenylate kinase family enzyme
MRRVVVFGTTGSGKSTLAESLAARHGLRLIELDALFWGPDWQPARLELFRHRVEWDGCSAARCAGC